MPAARMGMVGNVHPKKLDVLAERLLVRYNAWCRMGFGDMSRAELAGTIAASEI